MNEELTMENIEQWNEENPDDCHSPWMGGFDDEYEAITPEEVTIQQVETSEVVTPVEEVQQESCTVSEDMNTEPATVSVEERNVEYQAPVEVQEEPQAVVEVPAVHAVSAPQTGDASIYPMVICVIVGIIICIIGMYFTKEKNKLDNMKSYNQGWHDCAEWEKEYCKKIDEFNSGEGE